MRYLNTFSVMIAAVAIALISFLSIHEYAPDVGLFWNVLNASIWLTSSTCGPYGPSLDPDCGTAVPYRWILMSLVIAVSAFMITKPNRKN
jgi:hypothetical protein